MFFQLQSLGRRMACARCGSLFLFHNSYGSSRTSLVLHTSTSRYVKIITTLQNSLAETPQPYTTLCLINQLNPVQFDGCFRGFSNFSLFILHVRQYVSVVTIPNIHRLLHLVFNYSFLFSRILKMPSWKPRITLCLVCFPVFYGIS